MGAFPLLYFITSFTRLQSQVLHDLLYCLFKGLHTWQLVSVFKFVSGTEFIPGSWKRNQNQNNFKNSLRKPLQKNMKKCFENLVKLQSGHAQNLCVILNLFMTTPWFDDIFETLDVQSMFLNFNVCTESSYKIRSHFLFWQIFSYNMKMLFLDVFSHSLFKNVCSINTKKWIFFSTIAV